MTRSIVDILGSTVDVFSTVLQPHVSWDMSKFALVALAVIRNPLELETKKRVKYCVTGGQLYADFTGFANHSICSCI